MKRGRRTRSLGKDSEANNRFGRRHLILKMVPYVIAHGCCRTFSVAAFSVSSLQQSSIRKRQDLVQEANKFRLMSSSPSNTYESSEPSTEGQESGLVLPSHPDFRIRSVMAPMVAASDFPFRLFLRKYCGVDLTYTQMLHSKNLITDPTFRKSHLDLWEAGATYPELLPSQLDCLGDLPPPNGPTESEASSPVMVQLAGNDVDLVVEAASLILDHTQGRVSGIDLNCGCPQGIARKGNYGGFLMERDFDRVCEILTALRRTLPSSTAVSAKIRLPVDDQTLIERIPRLMETGINFLTIHGRTLEENKSKAGPCHVDRIRLAVETAHKLDPNFPIVANGGIEDYDDVKRIIESTGAVAVMSSEALLETPNLFLKSSKHLTPRELLNQQLSFSRDYLGVCADVMPPLPGILGPKKGGSFNTVRGHLYKFLHRYLTEQPDLREELASANPMRTTISQALDIVNELEERYNIMSDEELGACRSSSPLSSWYRRHRQLDRRAHQKEIRVGSSLSATVREEQTLEERKRQIQDRIKRLKEQKKERQGKITPFI